MSIQTELHGEHKHLLEDLAELRALARDVPSIPVPAREERLAVLLAFLNGTLLTHARAEEEGLYRVVGHLLGDERAIEPMVHDHHVIGEYVSNLAAADASDGAHLQELLYGLHALVVAHFRKEEELYLPLLAQHN